MMKSVLAFYPYKYLNVIAIFLFAITFAGYCIWVFRPGSKKIYTDISKKILEDNQ